MIGNQEILDYLEILKSRGSNIESYAVPNEDKIIDNLIQTYKRKACYEGFTKVCRDTKANYKCDNYNICHKE